MVNRPFIIDKFPFNLYEYFTGNSNFYDFTDIIHYYNHVKVIKLSVESIYRVLKVAMLAIRELGLGYAAW
jgi:hypothetical protein